MYKTPHILIVDDEEMNRELLEGLLECLGYTSTSVKSGAEAISCLGPEIDLILLDVNMPEMDGFATTAKVRECGDCADVPIIMVTALSSKEDRLRAVEAGANDFICKPVDRTELRIRVASLLKMKQAQDALKKQQEILEAEVERRTQEIQSVIEFIAESERQAHDAHLDTIRRLAVAAEYRDENTAAHIHRVSYYSGLLAERLGLPRDEVDTLRHAAAMHDVGKIGVPDAIMLKPGALTPEERAVMEQHTLIGARILHNSNSPLLQTGETIALTHHEKWDGTGYPNGLKGKDIPIFSRICAIADVFDALTTSRPYKAAFPNEKALDIMREGRGKHFDPELLDLFFECLDGIFEIQNIYSEDKYQPVVLHAA